MALAITLHLKTPEATDRMGEALARMLHPGDLITLQGDLGAGKSALARAIIRTLLSDPDAEIPSPSFALVQPYEAEGQTILHADLYRITDPGEIDELGLFDDGRAIVLVEWPERASELSARETIGISLSIPSGGEGRTIKLTFADDRRQGQVTAMVAHMADTND